MLLQQLHTLTGCLILLCFAGKLLIHYYLDRSEGRVIVIVYSFFALLPFLLPYKETVADKYLWLRKLCNLLLRLTAINLLLNFIIGLFILFS